MTIQAVFQKGSERVIIRVIGNNVLFIDLQNNLMAPIEGLKISKQGVEREYPDLINDPEWRQKAIQRFVDKIKSFQTEDEKMNWLIKEMNDMGYIGLYKQKSGFRIEKIK